MIKTFTLLTSLLFIAAAFGQKNAVIKFVNTANDKKIVLNDSFYTNGFGEKYTVSKLKYYISNIHFITAGRSAADKNVFLIDAAKTNSVTLKLPAQHITGIEFTVGVDSILNCSGAQSGALDPLNDMFWTWNSGYVMFKMEGQSDSSKADLHRIEQHIGGYKGMYKTMRKVQLNFKDGPPAEIVIELNLDKYWNGINQIKIAERPMTTTIGADAKAAADNFSGMFSLKE